MWLDVIVAVMCVAVQQSVQLVVAIPILMMLMVVVVVVAVTVAMTVAVTMMCMSIPIRVMYMLILTIRTILTSATHIPLTTRTVWYVQHHTTVVVLLHMDGWSGGAWDGIRVLITRRGGLHRA